MERDEVGLGEEVVEVDRLHPRLQVQLGRGPVLVGDDPHPEGPGPHRHRLTDVTEADDPQGLAVQPRAHQLLLDPATLLEGGVAPGDAAGEGHEEADGQLRHRQGVGGGGVYDLDAPLDGGGDVDRVQPGSGPGDDAQPLGTVE